VSAYSKSVQLGLGGTDAGKVAILQTLTVTDVTRQQLGKWLRENGLLSWTGTSWYGSIQTAIDSSALSAELVSGIDELKSILVGVGGYGLATTHQLWAPIAYGLVSQLAAGNSEMLASFYALAGGRPYADLTVEQFTSQREAAEAADAAAQAAEALQAKKDAWQQRFDAALNTLGTVEQADGIADVVAISQEMSE
jgi:hypothetical protein